MDRIDSHQFWCFYYFVAVNKVRYAKQQYRLKHFYVMIDVFGYSDSLAYNIALVRK